MRIFQRKIRGQSIVEAALILPMLILLLLGIVEFARLFNYKLTLNYAVNEGAKAAAYKSSPDTIRNVIEKSVTAFTVADENISINYQDSSDNPVTYGINSDNKVYFSTTAEVFVTIITTYDYVPMIPYPDIGLPDSFTLDSQAYVKVQ